MHALAVDDVIAGRSRIRSRDRRRDRRKWHKHQAEKDREASQPIQARRVIVGERVDTRVLARTAGCDCEQCAGVWPFDFAPELDEAWRYREPCGELDCDGSCVDRSALHEALPLLTRVPLRAPLAAFVNLARAA
jgi:hypothetical protein